MKKGLKIFLIIFIPLMLGILSFGGTALYSYYQVDYSVGETSVAFDITPDFVLGYVGFIELTTPAEIQNNGLYSIRDLTITVDVYGSNFNTTTLDGELLGHGINELGDVLKGTTLNDDVIVEITLLIPLLAIFDGEFDIQITIDLKVDFGMFLIPLNIPTAVSETWDAPFTL